MTDRTPPPAPEPIHEGPLAGTHRWTFRVLDAHPLTAEVRRLRLASPGLERLAAVPGQDLMVSVPTGPADAGGSAPTINRRYTIRATVADPEPHLVVDVVVHGSGPGARWAAGAEPGDLVVAVGPRGKVVVDPSAAEHLFVGDAAGAPASLAMLESLPEGSGRAILLADDVDGVQPTTAPEYAVEWLVGASPDQVDARIGIAAATAAGDVHVYLAGERSDVARWRDALRQAGVPDDQVSGKAYWTRSGANAPHGEPAREP